MYVIPITQPGKTPAYTEEDVRAYIISRSSGHLITVSGAPFSIDAVEFVSREQAERMLRVSFGGAVAPGDLVCIVTLTGPFAGMGMSVPPGVRLRRLPAHAVLVFDAHDGKPILRGYRE